MKNLIIKFHLQKTGVRLGMIYRLKKNKWFVLFNFAIGYGYVVEKYGKNFYLHINPPQIYKAHGDLIGISI